MGISEADQQRIKDLGKEAAGLLRLKELLETVELCEAILIMWGQVNESFFGPLNFWQWLELWTRAPLYHPLKSIAPERMALQAEEDLEKWKLVWGKARPYTSVATKAEFMVEKL